MYCWSLPILRHGCIAEMWFALLNAGIACFLGVEQLAETTGAIPGVDLLCRAG